MGEEGGIVEGRERDGEHTATLLSPSGMQQTRKKKNERVEGEGAVAEGAEDGVYEDGIDESRMEVCAQIVQCEGARHAE